MHAAIVPEIQGTCQVQLTREVITIEIQTVERSLADNPLTRLPNAARIRVFMLPVVKMN